MDSIVTESLTKSFGGEAAVDSLSLAVADGEIFGFLGPNGAGKSTTMMVLATLLRPTSGSASVAGHDVASEPRRVRECIGYVQQETTADEYLTGRENLQLHARLCHMGGPGTGRAIDAALELVELADRQHDHVVGYSGGMRKRLDMACGLLHRPRVLFLDEPTVGLDIQARARLWEYIRRINSESGTTVFLSTHYMEEADRLCGRVGIIDSGRMRAVGAPGELKRGVGGEAVSVRLGAPCARLVGALRGMAPARVSGDGLEVRLAAEDGTRLARGVFDAADEAGAEIEAVTLERPTLDDVFLAHTGRQMRDGGYNRRREHAKMRRLRA